MKFKIGDRVAVYGTNGNFQPVRVIGTVAGFDASGSLQIEGRKISSRVYPRYDLSVSHPKQCRRLKVQIKRKPIECWGVVVQSPNGVQRLNHRQVYCSPQIAKDKLSFYMDVFPHEKAVDIVHLVEKK